MAAQHHRSYTDSAAGHLQSLVPMASTRWLNQFAGARMLARKGSCQAWKCVSFGCSLLALTLLLAKYHEVSNDLHLLLSIEQLQQQSAAQNLTTTSNSSNNNSSGDGGQPIAWPPVPLEFLLSSANESGSVTFGLDSLDSNNTMLMSHMHMSLNRELNGDQILRREVAAFVQEFRNAKSTLGLSALLVAVYLLCWILMALAVNDTRLSVSLTVCVCVCFATD